MKSELTFQLVSFGCKVNQAEGEALAEQLARAGLRPVPGDGAAGLVVVNTCAVTGEAARQARQCVRRALGTGAAVAVTGCAAHPAAGDAALRAIPGILFLEPDKDRVLERLLQCGMPAPAGKLHAECRRSASAGGTNGQEAAAPRLATGQLRTSHSAFRTGKSRALLKVQDGCPASCAYCIVPKVRPAVWSLAPEDAARRVGELVAEGFREIVLCGIRLGLYGAGAGPHAGLVDLIDRLLAACGPARLRLSSLEPMEATDALVARMAAEPGRLCPHLHLPLQSGADGVLRRMGRPYSAADFLAVVGRARKALPQPAVTTDVLVGFPGETDDEFARTLAVCRAAGFSRIHVFPFSPRPGTRAAGLAPQVPPEVIRARRRQAAALGQQLAAAYRAGLVGSAARVVIEKVLAGGAAEGLSERYVRVRIRGPLPPGARRREILPVRLTGAGHGFLDAAAPAE